MITHEFNFQGGIITKNDLDIAYQDEIANPGKDNVCLKEDLLQIQYLGRNIVLDVGWYGDAKIDKGNFIVYIIENYDWEKPSFRRTAENFDELRQVMRNALEIIGSGSISNS